MQRLLVLFVLCLVFCSRCQALRCRTDDGPSEGDLKRIVRICMHKVGENDTDDDYNYDVSDSDESDSEMKTERSNPSLNLNNRNNQRNMPYNPYGNFNPNLRRNVNSNNDNNWNGRSSQFDGMSMGMGMNIQRNNNNPNVNFSANKSNSNNNNQTEQDRACLVHCFFHELKMTNNEDFPDKRKMIQTLTKDIREHEIKDFYVDSIQECFHMIDNMDNYNRRKNKCDVALTLITCLTERAKTNCEDFQNNMIIF